jgi:hypothetical protein
MSAHMTSVDGESHNPGQSLSGGLERWTQSVARFSEGIAKAFAIGTIFLFWTILGGAFWILMLIAGLVIVLVISMVFLLAGIPLNRLSQRFFEALRFWPQGFREIGLFSADHPPIRSEPSYLSGLLKILYMASVAYLLFCWYLQAEPIRYLLSLPIYLLEIIALLLVLTVGFCFHLDHGAIQNSNALSGGPLDTAASEKPTSVA